MTNKKLDITCRRGHPRTEENTYHQPGTRRRACRVCGALNKAKQREEGRAGKLGRPRREALARLFAEEFSS